HPTPTPSARAPRVISVTSSRLSTYSVSGRSAGIEVVLRSPYSLTVVISRVSGERAWVSKGKTLVYFLAGAMSADGALALGGLAAVPLGECAPAASSGF